MTLRGQGERLEMHREKIFCARVVRHLRGLLRVQCD